MGGRTWSTIHFLSITKKMEKVQEHDLYLNQILHHFNLKKIFPRMNNKSFTKRGPQGALLLFLYEMSIVVLIDFIAILLNPGILLIIIIYYDFLPTPRRGSHVKSDKTHTQSSRYTT